jgi:cell division protein FtsB
MRSLIATLTVLFIILQWRLWIGEHSLAELSNLQQQIAQQQRLNVELEQGNQQIKALVRDLKQHNDAFEEISRLKLGLVKDNETFYLFSDSP